MSAAETHGVGGAGGGLAAMILAAGRGERMRPLSAARAKPALPLFGLPFVARIVRHLRDAGVERFALNAHHGAESLARALEGLGALEQVSADASPGEEARAGTGGEEGVAGPSLALFREATLMGTGGALLAPKPFLGRSELFVLHNGDTIIDAPLDALVEAARGPGRIGAMLVRPGGSPGYGRVALEGGLVRGLLGADDERRDAGGESGEGATYLGVGVLRREVLEVVPPGRPSQLFPDVLLPLLAEGRELAAVAYEGPWLEFTSPASYRALVCGLASRARRPGLVRLPGGDAAIERRPGGTLWSAEDARVARHAQVAGGVVVERGARVAGGARIESSLVLEGAEIAAGAMLRRVVVAAGARVPAEARFENGTLVDDNGTLTLHPFPESSP